MAQSLKLPPDALRDTLECVSVLKPIMPPGEELCLACGLCCNGVIFADVRLQPGDDAEKLSRLGLPLTFSRASRQGRDKSGGGARQPPDAVRFPQPCAALEGCRCRIYPNRPTYCRQFECLLFKAVRSGDLSAPAALRLIRTAKRRAEKVARLLRELGDTDEHLALALRFRRTKRRLEPMELGPGPAEAYGQLTLAMHDLNLVLGKSFYA